MQIQQLVSAAQQAMQTGRMDDAARAWTAVLAASPQHAQALFFLGQHRLTRQDAEAAVALFERAANADPKAPIIPLNLALAQRAAGNVSGELIALERSLSIDPYYLPALLAKADAVERTGNPREAARIYKDALSIAPPDEQLAPDLRPAIDRARARVSENTDRLERHLNAALAALPAASDAGLDRFERCRDALLGRRKIYVQQPTMLHYPELPAIQFYERQFFPWLAELEASAGDVRDELVAVLGPQADEFRPYVQNPASAPLNQWAELNNSRRWSALFLWEDGTRNDEHCARCPRTAALMERMPSAQVPGYAPAVFFSVLEPHTRIPAHTGVTNTRLIVHLPLLIPEKGKCFFRVGNETREFEEGQAWVFDDTIEHEAWNDSDRPRAILIFDIWNPLLSEAERERVSAMMVAIRNYYRQADLRDA
ncbi:MAG TPA: aspartyl/asparaginyl beta-hydroxylase domain-containing protein [Rhizomicrobium sp.]